MRTGQVASTPLVFINYSSRDEPLVAALLYRELTLHFGDGSTFLDYESMPAGTPRFDQFLLTAARQCSVMLSVIGREWLTNVDQRPADCTQGWVRKEIRTAFRSNVTVVPILVEGARMPPRSALPASIRRLTTCQYRQLRHRSVGRDLTQLMHELEVVEPRLGSMRRLPTA